MYNVNNARSNISSVLGALVIMSILIAGCGRFGGSSEGVRETQTFPTIDPSEPFPAMSPVALDALIVDVPELAKYREKFLAAERDAIKSALVDLRTKAKGANTKSAAAFPESPRIRIPAAESRDRTEMTDARVGSSSNDSWAGASFGLPFSLVTVAMAADPQVKGFEEFLIGHQITFFVPGQDKSTTGSGSMTVPLQDEKTGAVLATATYTIDTAGGPQTLELATAISIPFFGLEAGSKVSIKGNACPDSGGRVDLTVKLVTDARSGRAGSLFYDKSIEARIVGNVGDDANLISADIDRRQATHATTGGQQVDFITSTSTRITGESYRSRQDGEAKIERGSKVVSPADQQASDVGLENAFHLAQGALEAAKERWKSGGCVEIEATSPGTVAINSTTPIPIRVIHKLDHSEVPSVLEVKLAGEKSIDPTSLAKTPGTITYTAPAETGMNATIGITATSRRGKATRTLTASTGGASYQIVGGLDDWQTDTKVCDIMVPFQLSGGGFSMGFSGGLSGTYDYIGPFDANGHGTYTISLPNGSGKPGTMTGSGAGQITGDKVYRGSGTEKYKLTPIEPCS